MNPFSAVTGADAAAAEMFTTLDTINLQRSMTAIGQAVSAVESRLCVFWSRSVFSEADVYGLTGGPLKSWVRMLRHS